MSGEGPCRGESSLTSDYEPDEAQTSISHADGNDGGQSSIENRTFQTPLVSDVYHSTSNPSFQDSHHSSVVYLSAVQPVSATDRGTQPPLPEHTDEIC